MGFTAKRKSTTIRLSRSTSSSITPEVLLDVLRLDAVLAGDLLLDELEVDPHGAQRILDLVRHARGERGEGRKALRAAQPRLLGALLRHVLHVHDVALHAALPHEREEAHGEDAGRARRRW